MSFYELESWLSKIYEGNELQQEICDVQIDHIKKLLILREWTELVAADLIYASIELTHVAEGKDGLIKHAEYLRSMATTIERRIKRNEFRVVSKPSNPANQS